MSDESKKFADSAKNDQPKEISFFEHDELDQATAKIINLALKESTPKPNDSVNRDLVAELRRVKKEQVYLGERNEQGKSIILSFDKYLKKMRKILKTVNGKLSGDAYKRIKEAVVHEKLEDCGSTTLPIRRSQLHKLGTVDEEGQFEVWTKALLRAPVPKITPKIIALTAHECGYKDVKLPGLTASEKKTCIEEDWKSFKKETLAKFGDDIRPFFSRMDRHLAAEDKNDKREPDSVPLKGDGTIPAPQGGDKPETTPQPINPRRHPEKPTDRLDDHAASTGSDKNRHTFRLPDQSSPVGMISPARPFVTSWSGHVCIAFDSPEHRDKYLDAGFPNPKANGYVYQNVARGLWKRSAPLAGEELDREIMCVVEQLEKASKKINGANKAA